jgi:hypothetical protein
LDIVFITTISTAGKDARRPHGFLPLAVYPSVLSSMQRTTCPTLAPARDGCHLKCGQSAKMVWLAHCKNGSVWRSMEAAQKVLPTPQNRHRHSRHALHTGRCLPPWVPSCSHQSCVHSAFTAHFVWETVKMVSTNRSWGLCGPLAKHQVSPSLPL